MRRPSLFRFSQTAGLFFLLLMTRCGSEEEYSHIHDVTDRLQWGAVNAVFEKGIARIQSPDGVTPAMIRQRTKRLRQNRVYRLSVQMKAAEEPTATLHADLFLEDEIDSPEHELVVLPQAISATPRRFERLLNSRTFSEPPYLRVFTFSTVPVLIQEVTLMEVH